MHKFDRRTLAHFLPNPQAIATFERLLGDVNGMPGTIEEAQAVAAQALAAAASALAMLAETAAQLEQLAAAPVQQEPAEADDFAPRAQLGTISQQNHDAVEITGGTINGTPIGEAVPAAAKVTTLVVTALAKLNPVDENVELKPTGTGTVVVAPAQPGTVNNMQLGNATPASARVTTLQTDQLHTVAKGAKFSGAATLAAAAVATFSYEHPFTRFYIGDGTGYSFRFAKRTSGATTDVAIITDEGAASFVGGFGCNGKAAQPAVALGAAATDAATTQSLVNTIRAALIANGIGN